jgi:hypothetical protein
MDGVSTLPIASRLPDQLSEGIGAAGAGTAAASAPHPVALIEARCARQQDANRMALLSRLSGAHLPMKLHMEQVRATPDSRVHWPTKEESGSDPWLLLG